MLTPDGVGFYPDMVVRCLAIPPKRRRSNKSTFFFLCIYRNMFHLIINYIKYNAYAKIDLAFIAYAGADALASR